MLTSCQRYRTLFGPCQAIAIFNGDCPVVCLISGEQLAVLHAGYRCLIRKNQDEPNIIEAAVPHFEPLLTHAFIWGGIGPCCWVPEYDDKPEILVSGKHRDGKLITACLSRTTRSPLASGKVSVDLYELARRLLVRAGIPDEHIQWDTTCTCCARYTKSQPRYWSHTRLLAEQRDGVAGAVDGRNMAVAWLRQEHIPWE